MGALACGCSQSLSIQSSRGRALCNIQTIQLSWSHDCARVLLTRRNFSLVRTIVLDTQRSQRSPQPLPPQTLLSQPLAPHLRVSLWVGTQTKPKTRHPQPNPSVMSTTLVPSHICQNTYSVSQGGCAETLTGISDFVNIPNCKRV